MKNIKVDVFRGEHEINVFLKAFEGEVYSIQTLVVGENIRFVMVRERKKRKLEK